MLTNARTQAGEFAKYRKSHPNFSPGELAAFTQRPLDRVHYAKTVNSLMPFAREILGGLNGSLTNHAAAIGSGPDLSWYRKQQGISEPHAESRKHVEETHKLLKGINDKLDKQLAHQEKAGKEAKRLLQTSTNDAVHEAGYIQKRLGANIV